MLFNVVWQITCRFSLIYQSRIVRWNGTMAQHFLSDQLSSFLHVITRKIWTSEVMLKDAVQLADMYHLSWNHTISGSTAERCKWCKLLNVAFTSGMISNVHRWFVQLFTSKLLYRCTYLHILFMNIESSVLYFWSRRICFQCFHFFNPTD